MKRLLILIVAGVLLLGAFSASASAGWVCSSQYPNWFLKYDNCGNHDGWWYYRTWVRQSCYPHKWHWRYTRSTYRVCQTTTHCDTRYDSASLSYRGTGKEVWLPRLLGIVERRDRYEARARASALQHQEFLETVKAFGLTGNFRYQGYGYSPTYAGGELGYASQRDFGNAMYAYTTHSLADPKLDPAKLARDLVLLQKHISDGHTKMSSEFTASMQQLVQSAERKHGLENRSASALQALETVRAILREAEQATVQATPKVQAQAAGVGLLGATDREVLTGLKAVVDVKCTTCHNPAKVAKGRVDLTDLSKVSRELWYRPKTGVIARVLSDDPEVRMPKGGKLSATQKVLFCKGSSILFSD